MVGDAFAGPHSNGGLPERSERSRQLASQAAHELRTPLAALRIHLEEALLYPGDADPYTALSGALRCVEQMEKVIGDLLLLVQLGIQDHTCREPVNLTELVTIATTQRSTTRILTDLEDGISVHGARAQLTHLLQALLRYAERHSHSSIEVMLYRHEGDAVLTITGDTKGVPNCFIEALFARLDTLCGQIPSDARLGLAIAREVAAAHGGSVSVEICSRGSRFVCRLPSAHQ